MKKHQHILIKSIILLLITAFTYTAAYAQEVKEEKKLVKIRVIADEDGNVSVDTSFVLDEDIDDKLNALIEDEEMLEKLEEIEIDLDIDADGKVYLIKSPQSSKKGYYYSVDNEENMIVDIDGDTTMTFVIKTADCKKGDGEKEVMVWYSDEDGKHRSHDKDHHVVISKTMDVRVNQVDGDSTITYTIITDGEEGEQQDVMIWTSDEDDMGENEIIVKKVDGDSNIFIMVTASAEAHAHAHEDGEMAFVTVSVDDDGNVSKKIIKSGEGEILLKGDDIEILELKDHDGAIIYMSKIKVSDVSASELSMLEDAGVKLGKENLYLNDFKISQETHSKNIKVQFTAHELKNVSISFLDSHGKQLLLEELKILDGKYIREIEIPDGKKGDYFFHIRSGKEGMTKKITLE